MLTLILVTNTYAQAQSSLPVVEGVEFGPLRTQCRDLLQVLETLKAPLPAETIKSIRALLEKDPTDTTAATEIQRLLDRFCLIGVTINPESRVKAARGPAAAELRKDQEAVVLVKIQNEAGVTHALQVTGPELSASEKKSEERWLEANVHADAPLGKKLSGHKVEYKVLRLIAHQVGKREATLQFDVGQGTQDLGFRAEVPVLFTIRKD